MRSDSAMSAIILLHAIGVLLLLLPALHLAGEFWFSPGKNNFGLVYLRPFTNFLPDNVIYLILFFFVWHEDINWGLLYDSWRTVYGSSLDVILKNRRGLWLLFYQNKWNWDRATASVIYFHPGSTTHSVKCEKVKKGAWLWYSIFLEKITKVKQDLPSF